jgi:magnesium-dependent phosphatase-1
LPTKTPTKTPTNTSSMAPAGIRLIIFDCDLTLWNHEDASELHHPLELLSADTLEDRRGTQVTLFPQVRSTLADLEQRGYLLSVCSWNRPEPVMEMLRLFGILHYFRHPKAEYHPNKGAMIAGMLAEFAAEGIHLSPDQVVFTDDRTLHTEEILQRLPGLHVLQMWVDVKDHSDLLRWLGEHGTTDTHG